jgi:putative nucleotidyltransferase with HDIG domain
MDSNYSQLEDTVSRPRFSALILSVATGVLAFFVLVLPLSTRPARLLLQAGQVAPQDIQAPRAGQYVSKVLTEQAQQNAERAVEPVYSSADPSIARHQLERLHTTLQYITLVRDDPNATPAQKQADLTSLSDIKIKPESVSALLGMTDSRWDAVQQESLRVLEQAMRGAIRQDGVEQVQRSMPALVSLTLTDEQAQLVTVLAGALVVPNSFYSPDLTDAARKSARDAVEPVTRTFIVGETIVYRGEVLTAADMEALTYFGLIEPENRLIDYLGTAAVVGALLVYVVLYFFRRRLPLTGAFRNLVLVAGLFLLFLVGARLTIPDRTVIPYIFPIPAFGLLIGTLFGTESGMVLAVPLCLLAAYGLPNSLDLGLNYLVSSWCGLLVLGPARRLSAFFRAGAGSALAGIAVLLAYKLPAANLDWIGIVTLTAATLGNGLASAGITIVMQYFLAQLLGLTTALQLLEISRPDFPLLQFFLRSAPGTYQHSLQVANLAEQAGEAINADTLAIRVGALYHDCGKATNPSFFIENQVPGSINTHDDLDPEVAASTVIQHVIAGLQLTRKHRLPERIRDFISEHHGTLATRYQYNRAVEAAGGDASKVDINKFRYPGPKPRSRETAILMLADGVEARARAERPKDETELRALIHQVIEHCQEDGQLDNVKLTLHDLHRISESFVTTLRGTYHPRITYPSLQQSAVGIPGETQDEKR